ncbi:MAG: YbaK/EbsC family protein [Nitrospinae bacterium]|nr:YbaK/EbsC family protein [Nitrospinota bacterium]
MARALQVLGESLAKVIMVKVKDRFVMTVLPSTWKVDLKRLKDVFQTRHARLAPEEEFQGLFPDCDFAPCRRLATSTVEPCMWTEPSRRTKRSSFRQERTVKPPRCDTMILRGSSVRRWRNCTSRPRRSKDGEMMALAL